MPCSAQISPMASNSRCAALAAALPSRAAGCWPRADFQASSDRRHIPAWRIRARSRSPATAACPEIPHSRRCGSRCRGTDRPEARAHMECRCVALFADLAHEALLMRLDIGIWRPADTTPAPSRRRRPWRGSLPTLQLSITRDLRPPVRLLDPMLFKRHDQSAARRQQVDRGRHGKIRIEQHRTAMRRQRLDQKPLGRRYVGIGRPDPWLSSWPARSPRTSAAAGRAPPCENAHPRPPVAQGPRVFPIVLIGRSFEMQDSLQVSGCRRARPARVHLSAAAAAANDIASAASRRAPMANA